MSKVDNNTKIMQDIFVSNKYELVPIHKLQPQFREDCYQLIEIEFPGYFDIK